MRDTDPVLAAIDCGTNSTRLLIARGTGADKEALARVNTITRLGRGVDASGELDPAAIARTVGVLEEYRGLLDEHGVERVRMTATSAARDTSSSRRVCVRRRRSAVFSDSSSRRRTDSSWF